MQRVTRNFRRGTALIYATVAFIALIGMVALGVDWGRVQLTKTELHAAAVASARYAAAGLQNNLFGASAAAANAAAVAGQNYANGKLIVIDQTQDVEIGVWDPTATPKFTPTTDLSIANAAHVTLRCAASRGTGLSLPFLGVLTRNNIQDVSADSIAMVTYVGNIGGAGNGQYQYMIPATSNPWLSGMPKGTIASAHNQHNNPDYAGVPFTDAGQTKSFTGGTGFSTGGSTDAGSSLTNYAAWGDYAAKMASPIQGGGIAITPGSPITFDGVNGGATNSAGGATVSADGSGANFNIPTEALRPQITGGSPNLGAENGIANVHAPLNSVIGVFLSDDQPDSTPVPAALDFSSSGLGTNFKSLNPLLKQPFFIGDGRTSSGEVQQFVPPVGATRLFIGTMDEYEWSNNVGGFYVTAHAKGKIVTVK